MNGDQSYIAGRRAVLTEFLRECLRGLGHDPDYELEASLAEVVTKIPDKTVHDWKRGDKLFYEQIIDVQALGNGEWWEKWPADDLYSDNVIITRDVKITIIVEEGEPSA